MAPQQRSKTGVAGSIMKKVAYTGLIMLTSGILLYASNYAYQYYYNKDTDDINQSRDLNSNGFRIKKNSKLNNLKNTKLKNQNLRHVAILISQGLIDTGLVQNLFKSIAYPDSEIIFIYCPRKTLVAKLSTYVLNSLEYQDTQLDTTAIDENGNVELNINQEVKTTMDKLVESEYQILNYENDTGLVSIIKHLSSEVESIILSDDVQDIVPQIKNSIAIKMVTKDNEASVLNYILQV